MITTSTRRAATDRKHTAEKRVNLGASLNRAGFVVTVAGAVGFIAAFVYVAISRMGYPFALEWLEGGSYAQVNRLLTGQPLYARPSMEYVAMIYPPLYYYAAAVLSRLLGFSLLPLRLISFASSLGAMLAIFLIIRQQGGRPAAALIGSGLFAATYHLSGSWFDIARVDMLAVFLVLLAVWMLNLQGRGWPLGAALVFALACLTKQIHLITLVCLAIYFAVFDRRRLLTFVLPCLALLAMAYLALNQLYEGWFGFFVLGLALGSGEFVTVEPGRFAQTSAAFWLDSVLLAVPFLVIGILIYGLLVFRHHQARAGFFFSLAVAAGLIGTSWSVVQVGGYKNDLVPAYAAIGLLAGIALEGLLAETQTKPALRGILLTACILQLAMLWYPIAPEIPSPRDAAAGNLLLNQIRQQPGEVYVPFHPELSLMAGKHPFASWSPMYQLEGNFGGGDIRAAGRVKTEFARAMERQQFSAIILDQEPNWIWGDPERFYARSPDPIFADPHVFWPVTGWQTRPEILLLPLSDQ